MKRQLQGVKLEKASPVFEKYRPAAADGFQQLQSVQVVLALTGESDQE
ncbi:hypothetical protein ACR6A7_16085 [Pantoea sp. RRHST58]